VSSPPDGPADDRRWAEEVLAALLAGPWTRESLLIRLSHAVGRLTPDGWCYRLADRLIATWRGTPSAEALAVVLAAFPPEATPAEVAGGDGPQSAARREAPRITLAPTADPIQDRADLRRLLVLTDGELDWFADRQNRLVRTRRGPLTHYRYRVLETGRGHRLLEIPKPRLKEAQRRLLRHVVGLLPLHPAAHGSVSGRSVRTGLAGHAGAGVIVRLDLESFFASITEDRVRGLLVAAGIEPDTASLLSGLCTSAVPVAVRTTLPRPADHTRAAGHWRLTRRLAAPHLPQGAPTSPGLANAIGFGLDHRLSRLAAALGGRYTRYVDDLVFSGPADLAIGALLRKARTIVADEGFRMSERKTAVLRASRRQQALGVVLNSRPALSRPERDRLRAILHNCRVSGVASQCRGRSAEQLRAELYGQVSWLISVDPASADRWRAGLAAIDWQS
jgi:RNA-directed DNA polymerase